MKTHSMPSSRDPKPFARRRSLAALALVAAGLCAATAHASIVNPSFEDVYIPPRFQDVLLPVGWNVFDAPPDAGPDWWDDHSASVWGDEWGWVTPPDGTRVLFVTSGARVWQTVTLTGGDQILLDVFVWSDGWTVGSAGMSISNGQSTWSSSLEFDSSWGVINTGWQQITLTVPASGTYELTLFNGLGGDGGALAFFDNIRVIPTPGAAALLGLSSVLVARRRRRSEEHSPVRQQIRPARAYL
jgi:hypothetical protein